MDFAPLDVNTFAPGFNLPSELFSIGNIFGFEHFDEDNSHWASEFWIENTIRELSLLQIRVQHQRHPPSLPKNAFV